MTGTIVQVSISKGGIPKRAIEEGRVSEGGLEGDAWAHSRYHGGPLQAVLVMAAEVIAELTQKGFPVYPGALGENLTTQGLDPSQWRTGQVYRAGTARLEFTKVRVPCRTIKVYGAEIGKAIYDSHVKAGDFTSPLWAFSGFYARIVQAGLVRAGDSIELRSELS